jgi:uncharacterized membrane protein
MNQRTRTPQDPLAYATPATEQSLQERRVRQVELIISTLLRVGVVTSLAIVVVGGIVTFLHHQEFRGSHEELVRITSSRAEFPHAARDVFAGLTRFEGRSIVMAGLFLLIATPVMRVAVSIFAFVYEHDRRYVIITSVVLALLILSFVLGKVEG